MILSFFLIPINMLQSLKGKELSNFANSNMSLNDRFQMKTVMSYASAANIASCSQIFSKLAPCQKAVLGE